MKILYVGDVMASPGRQVATAVVPKIREEYGIDVVVAQAENVTHGKSMSPAHMRDLQAVGIDFFTGGNHSIERKDILPLLDDPKAPVISPLNMSDYPDEWGYKELRTPQGKLLMISLLGQTVPQTPPHKNPLHAVDEVLATRNLDEYAAIVVNFHGDYSSEKRVIGYYLDGRVTAVIGDHWHVATADALVLPKGTAHITDVGMCGTLHSSLGVELETITKRWHSDVSSRNRIAEQPPYQFNAVVITTDPQTHLATKIEPINKVLEKLF